MSSHIWVSLNPVSCDSKSIILFSRLLISVSMDFFLLLSYFIDSPLTAIFMTSHRTWGFASWFISFMVFIVFLIKSTYSFSLRWLQFIFQKPFPLLVSNGMRSIRIREWSDLNPGKMFDDLILPEMTKRSNSLLAISHKQFVQLMHYKKEVPHRLDAGWTLTSPMALNFCQSDFKQLYLINCSSNWCKAKRERIS